MYKISKVVNFPFDTPAEKSPLTGMPFPLLVPQLLSPRSVGSSNLAGLPYYSRCPRPRGWSSTKSYNFILI